MMGEVMLEKLYKEWMNCQSTVFTYWKLINLNLELTSLQLVTLRPNLSVFRQLAL